MPRMRTLPRPPATLAWLTLALTAGCAPRPSEPFEHDVTSGAKPWTHEAFDDGPGRFTFAVFSDLNGGERDGVFAVAAEQLALLRPELVLSVGDLIDGPAADEAALDREWEDFDRRAGRIPAPVFRVGGNHDLTGQVLRDVWAKRFGPRYYHFVYKGVLFLVLDTEDHTAARMQEIFDARNEAIRAEDQGLEGANQMPYYRMPERITGNIGPEQSAYFLEVLAEHPDVRWTLLFMHKPVWRDGADPEFVAMEEALSGRPYTLFYGHLHTLSHTVRNGRDYIGLGTTGGSQSGTNPMAFDHVTLVTVDGEGPSIAHLRLDGILTKDGTLPAAGADLCFQASTCR